MKSILFCCFIYFGCVELSAQRFNLIPYNYKGLWGYSDTNGVIKIKPQFENADLFEDRGYTNIYNKDQSLEGLIDSTGKVILPCKYGNVAFIENFIYASDTNDEMRGLYLLNGKQILQTEYFNFGVTGNYIGAYARGKTCVFKYDPIQKRTRTIVTVHSQFTQIRLISFGNTTGICYISIDSGSRQNYYDSNGYSLSEYDVRVIEKKCLSSQSGKLGTSGRGNHDPGWGWSSGRDTSAYAIKNAKGKYDFVKYANSRKRDTITAGYDTLARGLRDNDFSEYQVFYAKQNGNWGVVDYNNHIIIPLQYDSVDLKSSTFNYFTRKVFLNQMLFVVKDIGKWGIVSDSAYNNTVLPCEYDSIGRLAWRLVILKKGNKYGFAKPDLKRTLVVAPKYSQIVKVARRKERPTLVLVRNPKGHFFWVNLKGREFFTE